MLIQFLIPAPFFSKSNLSEFKHFPCFARPGKTALREIINSTEKFDADPVV